MANLNIKNLLFPKQKYWESVIQKYAIYGTDENSVKIAPTLSIFDLNKMGFLSRGLLSRVYKLKDYDFVVKEGRWDMDFELFKGVHIPVNTKIVEKIFNIFSHSFQPKLKEVLSQYGFYLKFAEYFGYFSEKNEYYHPNLEMIHSAQRHLRNSLLFYKPEVEKHFKFKINPKIDEILLSDSRLHNFLPKEYTLYGKSVSKENEGKLTSFIIQKFVKGRVLTEVDETSLPVATTRELIVLLYLILLMEYQTGLVPDTRPKYLITQAYNWLLRTDNVMICNDGIKFIDTRWLWDEKSNIVKRGIIIPEMIMNLAKGYINFLLDSL